MESLAGWLLVHILFVQWIQQVTAVSTYPPCPLGPKQNQLIASDAVAVTPSRMNACGKDFMVSMDKRNGEPSVVLLSFDSSVASQDKIPAVLEFFVPPGSSHSDRHNITIFGFKTPITSKVSWDTLSNVLKPFDPAENGMTTCSDNVIQEDTVQNLGMIEIHDSENLSDIGGITYQIDVTKAVRQGIRSFALARMITCNDNDYPGGPQDWRWKGNITLSSLCRNDSDFHGQQFPPRIVFGSPPAPPKCTYKQGYYQIHINSLDKDLNHKEYFLTHSLKSKEKNIDVTYKGWIHKISNSRRLWKIREDTLSDTPMTFFGVKRQSKYSYLGGTKKGKPCLGRKTDRIKIIPRKFRCSQSDCGNVYLVSDRRKKQGKRSYLAINVENKSAKTVSWKYSWEVENWNGLFQLIPA